MSILSRLLIILLISFSLLSNGLNVTCFAQDNKEDSAQEVNAGNESDNNASNQKENEDTPAYRVLGRSLTDTEEKNYGNLDEEGIKNQILFKETKLVAVRALSAIGEEDEIEKVVSAPLPAKTFTDLREYFIGLREQYGTVAKGIKAIYELNIKDDEYAFKQAVNEAYENVFCSHLSPEKEEQFLKYFKEKGATTYSKMVTELQNSMSDEIKKLVLTKVLKEVGRQDLMNKEVFVNKILNQSFTCQNLRKLLKEVGK